MTTATFAIFVVATLLSVYFNHDVAFFSATLPSHLPAVAALLAVSQGFSVQAKPSRSCLFHSLYRSTYMMFALGTVAHRVAHAAYQNVTSETIADTCYNDTAVSINGSDIVIDLNKKDAVNYVHFTFNGGFQFTLEKGPTELPARIVIQDHNCKWAVDWNDEDCSVRPNERSTKWDIEFPVPKRGKIQSLLFRYDTPNERIACYDGTGGAALGFMDVRELCTWTSAVQGGDRVSAINVTYQLETTCPVKLVIINATLKASVPETRQQRTKSTTLSQLKGEKYNTTLPKSTDEEGGLQTWLIICIAVGGFLLLILIVGGIGMSVFFARPRGGKKAAPQGTVAKVPQATVAKVPPRRSRKADPEVDALIEWVEVQAHLPYVDNTTEYLSSKSKLLMKDFTIVNDETTKENRANSSIEVLEPVVGDYGHVKAEYVDGVEHPNRSRIHMYYSLIPERIQQFAEIATLAHRAAKGTDRDVLVVDVQAVHYPNAGTRQKLGPDPSRDAIRLHMEKYMVERTYEVSFLITRDLGPLLGAHLTKFEDLRMSLHDAAVYTYSSFQALRSLHQAGIVHRDVSPCAFVLQVDRPETLLMTNLSLARKIYDTETKTFISPRERVNFFGDVQCASRAAHKRQERSFKDDVESWLYTACQLMWPGETPWHNLLYDRTKNSADKDGIHSEFVKLKGEFLRSLRLLQSFVDTENPQPQIPIFASIAGKILTSEFESQTEDFAPDIAKKLEAFAKEVPEASKEKEVKHPPRKMPRIPRCLTNLGDKKFPKELLDSEPEITN